MKLAAILCSTFESLFQFESELQDRIASCAFLPFDKGKTHTHTNPHPRNIKTNDEKKRFALCVFILLYNGKGITHSE